MANLCKTGAIPSRVASQIAGTGVDGDGNGAAATIHTGRRPRSWAKTLPPLWRRNGDGRWTAPNYSPRLAFNRSRPAGSTATVMGRDGATLAIPLRFQRHLTEMSMIEGHTPKGAKPVPFCAPHVRNSLSHGLHSGWQSITPTFCTGEKNVGVIAIVVSTSSSRSSRRTAAHRRPFPWTTAMTRVRQLAAGHHRRQ